MKWKKFPQNFLNIIEKSQPKIYLPKEDQAQEIRDMLVS